jgi:hypothetical protein
VQGQHFGGGGGGGGGGDFLGGGGGDLTVPAGGGEGTGALVQELQLPMQLKSCTDPCDPIP